MVMICEHWIIAIPIEPRVSTPMFWTARRTAGQKTWMISADLTPSFLIVQPVMNRFITPKKVVEAPRRETDVAVSPSILRTLHRSPVKPGAGSGCVV